MVPVCTFSPLAPAYLVCPLWLYQFQVELCNQPDRAAIGYVLSGFWEGFSIGYEASPISLRSASSNMRSALVHPSVIDAYLQAEVSSGRIVGPFSTPPVPQLHISRLGVVPKSSQPSKWHLILSLLYPEDYSVNDGILKAPFSVQYVTV